MRGGREGDGKAERPHVGVRAHACPAVPCRHNPEMRNGFSCDVFSFIANNLLTTGEALSGLLSAHLRGGRPLVQGGSVLLSELLF